MSMEHRELVFEHKSLLDVPFIVISGPSGGGKTTLCLAIKNIIPNVKLLIKHTNRDMRPNEKSGVDYFFVDSTWFNTAIQNKAIISYADRYGNHYALSENEVTKSLFFNLYPIVILDVHLAVKFKSIYKKSLLVFVGPKDISEVEKRLEKRGDDRKDVVARVQLAVQELGLRNRFDFDYCDTKPPEIAAQHIASIIKNIG